VAPRLHRFLFRSRGVLRSTGAIDIHRVGDLQLRALWAAADRITVEKRGVLLERVVARLQLHRAFTDADLDDAVRAALTGLIQALA